VSSLCNRDALLWYTDVPLVVRDLISEILSLAILALLAIPLFLLADQVFFSSVATLGSSYLGVYHSFHLQLWNTLYKIEAVWKIIMDVGSCGGGSGAQSGLEQEASPPSYYVSVEVVSLYSYHAHTLLCAGQ
jgi:hypothetical protein